MKRVYGTRLLRLEMGHRMFEQGQLDEPGFRDLLRALGFSSDEIEGELWVARHIGLYRSGDHGSEISR